jgi:hypothetical protein
MLRSKCLLLGDACTGKTALAQAFSSDGANFPSEYHMVSTCTAHLLATTHWRDVCVILVVMSKSCLYVERVTTAGCYGPNAVRVPVCPHSRGLWAHITDTMSAYFITTMCSDVALCARTYFECHLSLLNVRGIANGHLL